MATRLLAAAAAFLAMGAATAAAAQPPTFATPADIDGLIARAKAQRKEGQNLVVQRLLQLPPYSVNLEYRPGVAPPAIHDTEAEYFYVLEGSGAATIGGTLEGKTAASPGNWSGKSIQGGEVKKIAKGDTFIVPEATAHQISTVDQPIVLISIHVPRGAKP